MFYTLRTIFEKFSIAPKKDRVELYLKTKEIRTNEQLEYWLKEYEKANDTKVW